MKKINCGLASVVVLLGTLFGIPLPVTPVEPAVPGKMPEATLPVTYSNEVMKQDIVPESASTRKAVTSVDARQQASFKDRRDGDQVIAEDGKIYPLRQYRPMLVPNDPFGQQWWTEKVSLASTWDVGPGSKQTLLAIIDTGYALNHEELRDRWYENTGEKGAATSEQASKLNCTDRGLTLNKSCNVIDDNADGVIDNETGSTTAENRSLLNCSAQQRELDKSCNMIDDDANGFTDDTRGWDFINGERSVAAGEVNPNGESVSHGTMVAGVAAANGNNSKGVSGVDWYTKILPLQGLADSGSGDTLTISRAIRYAADQGADVINLSLGAEVEDSYMRQAVQYAIKKGSMVVAAAGNDGCECVSYPARFPEVVAVGASDQNDLPASFSNWGPALDILAPGVSMRSLSWQNANQTTAYANNIAGTSFATPLVAGLLTRLKSQQPTASNLQLLAAVTEQTNRLTIPADTSRTNTLGTGRVNAGAVMSRITQTAAPTQRYILREVSAGTTIGNYEPVKPFTLYQCENNRPGTTGLYRLRKADTTVYSISDVERHQAAAQGYSEENLGLFCLNLPNDQPQILRSLSLAYELEQRTLKQ